MSGTSDTIDHKKGAFIAVAENILTGFPMQALMFFLWMSLATSIYALPVGGVISAGSASIGSSTSSTTITQSTQNVVLNWQSFNIASGEAVQFVQPNSSSVALNRVLGTDPSSILGSLTANGKVFLVNPNGILFGPGASVNVGGLVASTLNISDSEFMAGTYNFTGSGAGRVLNQGNISTNADGGYVALLGASVSNDGIITAKLGTVALAAGSAVTLDVAGDGLLNVTVSQGAVNALVQNGGLIQADGGEVLLTAQAAGNLLQSVVNNTGVIQAQSIENHNGTIKLLGDMQSGTVNVGGTLDASAPGGGNGGNIETSAAQVKVADNAIVSTQSIQDKSGTWLIDPTDFTISVAGGDITGVTLGNSLLASNITISSNNGLVGTNGDINVNAPVNWAGATTLTLNAVHDVLVNAPITANTAGANIVLTAGSNVTSTSTITTIASASSISINAIQNVLIGGAVTGTAANTEINISAGQNVTTTAVINAIAANSAITINAGNDISIGGAITGTAANALIALSAGLDIVSNAAITAVAAGSTINIAAIRDVTTTATAAILAVAATTNINLNGGHNVSVNSAITAGAAGSSINLNAGNNVNVNAALAASAAGSLVSLIAGLDGAGPGLAGGSVNIAGAVASLNTTIRFNPNGYVNTSADIAAYDAGVTGAVDAKAWVFVQGNNKTYDGRNAATLAFMGTPADGGIVTLIPGIATFDSKNVGNSRNVVFNGYSIGGTNAADFALFAGSGTTTANITPALLKVTAGNATKTYGQTSATLTAFTTSGLVNAETVGSVAETSTGTASTSSVAGGPYAITASSATGGTFTATNYSISYANGALTVIPASLIVTASNASKIYGQIPILTTFTTVGLLNGETIGSVAESSIGVVPGASVLGGPYPITPSNAAGGSFTASNYSINYVNGILTVNPTGLTVTVADATKTFGQTMTLTAFTVVGLVNGETIGAFSETSPGTAVNASVAGSPYVIIPSTANGGTFTASNYRIVYVNGTLTVLPQIQPLQNEVMPVISGAGSSAGQAVMPTIELVEAPAEMLAIEPDSSPSILMDLTPEEVPVSIPSK